MSQYPMSQYPSPPPPYPYPPPSPYAVPPLHYGYGPAGGGDPFGPQPSGRRAGTLMIVTGVLFLLFGGCNTANIALMSPAKFSENMRQQQAQMGQTGPSPVADGVIRGAGIAMGVAVLLLGVAMVVMGIGVRRGGRGWTVAALVVSGLITLGSGVLLSVSVLAALQTPLALVFGCLVVIPTTLGGLQTAWLIGALRARPAGRSDAAYQQYAAQWYQYQQAAQAYGGGYGYAAPPTAAGMDGPPSLPPPPA